MDKTIKIITKDNFAKYGYVIEHDYSDERPFQVILKEEDCVGWRIATSKITAAGVKKLAKHPKTMESFEPVSGTALICVAVTEAPEDYEVFLLDKPVCLYKDIWHATLTLSQYSIVKITENVTVSTNEYEFKNEVRVLVR